MAGLPEGLPEDFGIKTLGWIQLDWASAYLAQPDGHITTGIEKGDQWVFTADQARFMLWYYAVDDTGKYIFRRAYRERAKGVGKSPMAAAMGCIELLSEVVFDGWDAQGNPVGRPHPAPLVQLAAVSEQQTKQTQVLINSMLINGSAEMEYQLDIVASRIIVPDLERGGVRGSLASITASPRSKEGARPSFVILEESHGWVPAEQGPDFASVIRRNLAKGGGRSIEVTNAPRPGEESVAEGTHKEIDKLMAQGIDPKDAGILFDTEQVSIEDIYNREQAIPALTWIYRNSPWVDVNRIFDEVCDVETNDEPTARRYYFNEITMGKSGWLPLSVIEGCRKDITPLKKTDRCAMGFSAAAKREAGTIVLCRLEDMSLWVMDHWERPYGAKEWMMDKKVVDKKVRKTLSNYPVYMAKCNPHNWQIEIGKWAADFGEDCIEEFWMSSKANAAKAVEQFASGAIAETIIWKDQSVLETHILSCHKQEETQGYLIRKETQDSSRYISAAIAAVLAVEAAVQAIEDGALEAEDNTLYTY